MAILILCLIILVVIIVLLLWKVIRMDILLKDITMQLDRKMTGTNGLITTSSKDKRINDLIIKLNEELKKIHHMELQYENGNRELYKAITNISHDLRTPLTSIRGYIGLLKKDKDYKKVKKYIDIIDIKTMELVNLTEQLFSYSRSLDLKDLLVPERLCINDVLEEVILSYYELFKDKKINPIINICDKKIYREIDKMLLIRIFENVISNCIKYADEEIKITLEEKGKIVFANKTNALDSVSVQKIFDRYFTVSDGKRERGVGMSIVKQLVTIGKGKVKAYYKKGIFTLKLEF